MMNITVRRLEELTPYEKNPRKNKEAVKYVAESIKQFGFKVPLVIDKDGVIVTGHTRYEASKKLGLEEVPCIIADDLTDDQIRAFRLADNKVAEKAEWDFDLLNEEIDALEGLDFDFENFGFEFVDEEEKKRKNKEDVDKRKSNILNLEIAQFDGVGKFDIPPIEPVFEVPEVKEWIGFNYVLSDKNPKGKGVHFFIDDYQFIRLWNDPERYVDKLLEYEAVLTPDFSPYSDMPLVTQLFNHYRKHWIGAYLQRRGVNIIPTIRASRDERSLEWFTDGEPSGGVVAISSMWTNTDEGMNYFRKEYDLMFSRLKPKKVFVYGYRIDGLKGDIEYIENFTTNRWKNNG